MAICPVAIITGSEDRVVASTPPFLRRWLCSVSASRFLFVLLRLQAGVLLPVRRSIIRFFLRCRQASRLQRSVVAHVHGHLPLPVPLRPNVEGYRVDGSVSTAPCRAVRWHEVFRICSNTTVNVGVSIFALCGPVGVLIFSKQTGSCQPLESDI